MPPAEFEPRNPSKRAAADVRLRPRDHRDGSTLELLNYAHTAVFMCSAWIWEQTAVISVYSINRLRFITETESVYCAVRTGYLNVLWVICFIWIWEQTAIISLYSINWLVCITETESVYCAVRTTFLNIIKTSHGVVGFLKKKDFIVNISHEIFLYLRTSFMKLHCSFCTKLQNL